MFERLRQKSVERHLAPCPHCDKQVLDHMSACPFCGGALSPSLPSGQRPDGIKRLRRRLSIIGFVIAAALVIWRLTSR